MLACAQLSPDNTLQFALDSAGTAAGITVEIFEHYGQKNQRLLSARTGSQAAAGFQTLRIPLSRFAGKGGPADWSAITKLNLRWTMPRGSVWRLADVRIVKSGHVTKPA